MQPCNILIGCDQSYYEQWAINLIKSIRHFNPFVQCHVHIVNPGNYQKIPNVEYTTENINFPNEDVRIGYLQSVRFLKVAEKFSDKDLVMTLDADTICTRSFTPNDFIQTANKITCLRHLKDHHWLAGMVTFGQKGFKKQFRKLLMEKPIEDWKPFHDQEVLDTLSTKYKFNEQPRTLFWMSIGKNGNSSVFLTLKGNQKTKDKYLKIYNSFVV